MDREIEMGGSKYAKVFITESTVFTINPFNVFYMYKWFYNLKDWGKCDLKSLECHINDKSEEADRITWRGREKSFDAHLICARLLNNFSLTDSGGHPAMLAEDGDLGVVRGFVQDNTGCYRVGALQRLKGPSFSHPAHLLVRSWARDLTYGPQFPLLYNEIGAKVIQALFSLLTFTHFINSTKPFPRLQFSKE